MEAYRIASEMADAHNEKYEALKKADLMTYGKFSILEDELRKSLASLGYKVSWRYQEAATIGLNCTIYKVSVANIHRISEERL